jgi:hypothetical protein
MQWKKDLEALIKQTKALVAPSVEATQPEHIAAETKPTSPAEKFDAPAQPFRLTPPLEPMQWRPISRDEIKQRVATFKAHQQKFERDREDYCLQTLARTRAALEKEKRLDD